MKIYKKRNPNRRRIGVLFIAQVIFGTLPAILLLVFVFNTQPLAEGQSYLGAYISAAAIVLCAFAYLILGRRYNILLSGLKGEKSLAKIAKKHKGSYDIFLNCPVQYKRNRSEIDMIMVGKNGILIVEVKNHSGTISGSDSDENWCQYKHYRDGKSTEGCMKNPIKQITRQRDILKNILKSNGIDAWIDGVVYFSNPFTKLKLSLKSVNSNVCLGEKEIEKFIKGYKSPKKLSDSEIEKIKSVLRTLM